jgi:predicted RNase H-like nuclease (RuvC/YqgF family)
MDKEKVLNSISQEAQLIAYWKELVIDENIEDNRHQRNVMFRHAFLVSCRMHSALPIAAISSIMGKHHATLIHAEKNHESNLRFNKTYSYAFKRISNTMEEMFLSDVDVDHQKGLKGENKALRKRLMEITRRNRELIQSQVNYDSDIEEMKNNIKTMKALIKDRDERIRILNKKLSSIAW